MPLAATVSAAPGVEKLFGLSCSVIETPWNADPCLFQSKCDYGGIRGLFNGFRPDRVGGAIGPIFSFANNRLKPGHPRAIP